MFEFFVNKLKLTTNVFVLLCYLSSSLSAMDLAKESGRCSPHRSAAHTEMSSPEDPPPSQWSRVCSDAKEAGMAIFSFFTLQDSPHAQTAQKIIQGALHLSVGLSGIFLSSTPSDEELARTSFLDHTVRNARDMYNVSHCMHGAQLILEPLLGPVIRRLFPDGSKKMKSMAQEIIPFYQGAVNVIGGSGVIGYCRDMDSFLFALPGYGFGAILTLRGGQRLFMIAKGNDPLAPFHRYFKKSTIEYFLFTTQDSYLKRIMDGVAEVCAALTLHHALWPFIYYKTTDLFSFVVGAGELDPFCMNTAKEHIIKLLPSLSREKTAKYARETCNKISKSDQTYFPAKKILTTKDHLCLLDRGEVTCAFLGEPLSIDIPLDLAQSMQWSPGWRDQIKKDLIKVMGAKNFKEKYGIISFGGVFRETFPDTDYHLYSYLYTHYSRPFLHTLKVNDEKGWEFGDLFYPILTPPGQWFPYANRYIVSLMAHSWLDSQNLMTFHTLSRFMLAHGVLEIGRGIGGMVQIGYGMIKALAAYRALQESTEDQPENDDLSPPLSKPHRRQLKAVGTLPNPTANLSITAFSTASESPAIAAPGKKDKPKTRPHPGANPHNPEARGRAPNPVVAAPAAPPPVQVPNSFRNVLDHNTRALRQREFESITRDLGNLGVMVEAHGNNVKFQLGGQTLTIHSRHKPGQGTAALYGARLSSLRDFMQFTLAAGRQDQNPAPRD